MPQLFTLSISISIKTVEAWNVGVHFQVDDVLSVSQSPSDASPITKDRKAT